MNVEIVRAKLATKEDLAGVTGHTFRRTGQSLRAPCFLHGGKGLNLAIYDGKNGPRWACKSRCGGGDSIDLIARMHGIDPRTNFPEVLNVTASLLGLSDTETDVSVIERAKEKRAQREAEQAAERRDCAVLLRALIDASPLGGEVLTYLRQERGCWEPELQFLPATELGLGTYWPGTLAKIADQFGQVLTAKHLGAGDKDRLAASERDFLAHELLLPVTNSAGEVVAIQGRSIKANVEKSRRYTSRGNASAGFFGGRDLAQSGDALVVLCEGAMDTLTLRVHAHELSQTWGDFVAIGKPGAAGGLSRDQLAMLSGRRVLVAYDGDKAGREGAEHVSRALSGVGVESSILRVPDGHDLNSITLGGAS